MFVLILDLFVENLLNHLAELLLEISVLSDVSLRRLLSLLSDAVQFLLNHGLKLRNPLLSNFAHLADGAFPRAELIVLIVIRGHDEEEPLNFFIRFNFLRFGLMNVGGEVAE